MAILSPGTVVYTAQVDNDGVLEDHTDGWVFNLTGVIDDSLFTFVDNQIQVASATYVKPGDKSIQWTATKGGFPNVVLNVTLNVGDKSVSATSVASFLSVGLGNVPDWSDNFKIRYSFYHTGVPTSGGSGFGTISMTDTQNTGGPDIRIRDNGELQYFEPGIGSVVLASLANLPQNNWYEIEILGRSGPEFDIKLDGVVVHTQAILLPWPNNSAQAIYFLAGYGNNPNNNLKMSNLYIEVDNTVYINEEVKAVAGSLVESGTVTFDDVLVLDA